MFIKEIPEEEIIGENKIEEISEEEVEEIDNNENNDNVIFNSFFYFF